VSRTTERAPQACGSFFVRILRRYRALLSRYECEQRFFDCSMSICLTGEHIPVRFLMREFSARIMFLSIVLVNLRYDTYFWRKSIFCSYTSVLAAFFSSAAICSVRRVSTPSLATHDVSCMCNVRALHTFFNSARISCNASP